MQLDTTSILRTDSVLCGTFLAAVGEKSSLRIVRFFGSDRRDTSAAFSVLHECDVSVFEAETAGTFSTSLPRACAELDEEVDACKQAQLSHAKRSADRFFAALSASVYSKQHPGREFLSAPVTSAQSLTSAGVLVPAQAASIALLLSAASHLVALELEEAQPTVGNQRPLLPPSGASDARSTCSLPNSSPDPPGPLSSQAVLRDDNGSFHKQSTESLRHMPIPHASTAPSQAKTLARPPPVPIPHASAAPSQAKTLARPPPVPVFPRSPLKPRKPTVPLPLLAIPHGFHRPTKAPRVNYGSKVASGAVPPPVLGLGHGVPAAICTIRHDEPACALDHQPQVDLQTEGPQVAPRRRILTPRDMRGKLLAGALRRADASGDIRRVITNLYEPCGRQAVGMHGRIRESLCGLLRAVELSGKTDLFGPVQCDGVVPVIQVIAQLFCQRLLTFLDLHPGVTLTWAQIDSISSLSLRLGPMPLRNDAVDSLATEASQGRDLAELQMISSDAVDAPTPEVADRAAAGDVKRNRADSVTVGYNCNKNRSHKKRLVEPAISACAATAHVSPVSFIAPVQTIPAVDANMTAVPAVETHKKRPAAPVSAVSDCTSTTRDMLMLASAPAQAISGRLIVVDSTDADTAQVTARPESNSTKRKREGV
jgi:hypothetical protein